MNDFAPSLAALFKRDLARLLQEVEGFPDDASLWQVATGMNNSPGNLVLHLEGNLREYIGRLLGGATYQRHRDHEFSDRDVSKAELIRRVQQLIAEIPPVIAGLTNLDTSYPEDVLGSPISTGRLLMHLLGHFNYHLGQIDCARRAAALTGAIHFSPI
jgi:uncharacterized damage-inducible protein DinB